MFGAARDGQGAPCAAARRLRAKTRLAGAHRGGILKAHPQASKLHIEAKLAEGGGAKERRGAGRARDSSPRSAPSTSRSPSRRRLAPPNPVA